MKKILFGLFILTNVVSLADFKCQGSMIQDAEHMKPIIAKMSEHAQAGAILMDKEEVKKAVKYAKEAKSGIKHLTKDHRSELNGEMLSSMTELNISLDEVINNGEFILKTLK